MFSSATKTPGQGVKSAYLQLVGLIKHHLVGKIDLKINQRSKSDISHYQTIDPKFFLSTFLPSRGIKVASVHFLPQTIKESLNLPAPVFFAFSKYIIAFYKRMDALVVVNPNFIAPLVALGVDSKKITYIPNFVSPDDFFKQRKQTIQENYRRLHLKPQAFTILGVGQIQTRKGVDDFITLAKKNPHLQFIWAGGFSFGRLTKGYRHLKKKVDRPPKNLWFCGIISKKTINDLYNLADVFFLPSYDELFPMSILEAFNTSTPVVARKLPAYKKIFSSWYLPAVNLKQMHTTLNNLKNSPLAYRSAQKKSQQAASFYRPGRLAWIWFNFYCQQIKKYRQKITGRI